MKRCPTCDKTFDDNMRFCQTDGTALVEDAPLDPYKTMVAQPGDFANAKGSSQDDVLDLPADPDLAKTMYASEGEIRAEMAARDAGDVIDIPPLNEPEQPKFSEPPPPPSPFSSPDASGTTGAPIPSPFDEPKPSSYEPVTPSFAEPEEPAFNPFNQPPSAPMAPAEWTPPPVAQDQGWQNQQIGLNPPPFSPPAGGSGVNQTLPIISLVLGIASLCCYISPLTGIAAIITGFIGMKNANNDPNHFGGKGLAIAGMITGGVFALLSIIYWIFMLFLGGMGMLMDAGR